MTNTINKVITTSKLMDLAPSVFSTAPKDGLSGKYNFIPTIELVRELEHSGWLPVKAIESRVRKEANQGYQKHMIRFRNFNEREERQLQVGDCFIELVLTNSHNGLSAFVFDLGLFRLACSNGMVVPESFFDSVHIRHDSYEAKKVAGICAETVMKAPSITNNIEEMKGIELTTPEQFAFAQAAKAIRFDDPEKIDTERLLQAKRERDKGNDLWKTFNRVQENLEKGGILYSRFNDMGRYIGRGHTREVKSIDGGIKMNKALWFLAEEWKKYKRCSS